MHNCRITSLATKVLLTAVLGIGALAAGCAEVARNPEVEPDCSGRPTEPLAADEVENAFAAAKIIVTEEAYDPTCGEVGSEVVFTNAPQSVDGSEALSASVDEHGQIICHLQRMPVYPDHSRLVKRVTDESKAVFSLENLLCSIYPGEDFSSQVEGLEAVMRSLAD